MASTVPIIVIGFTIVLLLLLILARNLSKIARKYYRQAATLQDVYVFGAYSPTLTWVKTWWRSYRSTDHTTDYPKIDWQVVLAPSGEISNDNASSGCFWKYCWL